MKKPAEFKLKEKPKADEVPPVPVAVVTAIRALHEGQASDYQQRIALQWIVREACGKAHFPFHGTDRDTVFALGRQFVGDLVIGCFNADFSTLRSEHANPEKP